MFQEHFSCLEKAFGAIVIAVLPSVKLDSSLVHYWSFLHAAFRTFSFFLFPLVFKLVFSGESLWSTKMLGSKAMDEGVAQNEERHLDPSSSFPPSGPWRVLCRSSRVLCTSVETTDPAQCHHFAMKELNLMVGNYRSRAAQVSWANLI